MQPTKKSFLLVILRAILIYFTCLTTKAGAQITADSVQVQAIKGNKVLLRSEEAIPFKKSSQFYLIRPTDQKKVGLIEVLQVKNNKAVAKILKGKAEKGFTLQHTQSGRRLAQAAETDGSSRLESKKIIQATNYSAVLKNSYGVLGSILLNSMKAQKKTTTDTGSSTMSGQSFGVGGFYDLVIDPKFTLRGSGWLEQFNASGSISNPPGCDSSTDCSVKITYLSGYGQVNYHFWQKDRYRLWVGGGAGYLFAVSKSSSILNESQISTNQVYFLSVGSDIQMSRKNYIPVSLEYSMFPASDTVTASFIAIKAGWAWNL